MFDIHATRAAAYSVSVEGDVFRFRDANRAAIELCGFTTTFQPGLTPQDVFPAHTAATIVARYRACCAGEAVTYSSKTMVGSESRQWQTTLVPVLGTDGKTAVIYGFSTRQEDRAELSTLALEALDGGFWTLNLVTREFQTSQKLAEKLAGPGHTSLNMAEYIGYVHVGDLSLELPDAENEVTVEFRVFTYEGRMRWLRTRRRPVRDPYGAATHVIGVVLDITDEKLDIMRLEKEATTDNLTDVANRRAFDRAAERCFGDRMLYRFGVIVIDLDDFKPVNDRHGHRVGDMLLRQVGGRLAELGSQGNLLSRIGGDEFAFLLPDSTLERLDDLSRQIEAVFFEPFYVEGRAIGIGASCGSAIRCASDRSVGDIVARADQALYAAKDRRRRLIA